MSDLISRQAAIDAVHKDYDTILDFKSDGATVASSIEDILLALPSAQRCENCEHSSEAPLPNRDRWCNTLEIYCTSDWFCANWERRRK